MGYQKIPNLYKKTDFLHIFRRVWVSEKIHGTSTHLSFSSNDSRPQLRIFSGGAPNHQSFVALFDKKKLLETYRANFLGENLKIFGEGYGGKILGMSKTYGPKVGFIAFDAQIDERWCSVPYSNYIAKLFGLEFVWHVECDNEVGLLNKYRDQPSQLAILRECGNDKPSEGIVVRPLQECFTNVGERWIVKHKRQQFSEMQTPREIDPKQSVEKFKGQLAADEFITKMRVIHVLDKNPQFTDFKQLPQVIEAVIADVRSECESEIVWSKSVIKAMSGKTVAVYKDVINERMLASV